MSQYTATPPMTPSTAPYPGAELIYSYIRSPFSSQVYHEFFLIREKRQHLSGTDFHIKLQIVTIFLSFEFQYF